MFFVQVKDALPDGFVDCEWFAFPTEREARRFINDNADGGRVFSLSEDGGEVIVCSRFPVLMVA
jgi:hypothetical protein